MKSYLALFNENFVEASLIVVAIIASVSNIYTVVILLIVLLLKLFMAKESVIKHD